MKISNFKFQTLHSQQDGFTLIELLVVIALLVTIGSVVGSIIVSSFQTATKTNSTISIKRNGDYAVNILSRMIRNAQGIYDLDGNTSYTCDIPDTSPLTSHTSLTIKNPDNLLTTFTCDSTKTPATITSSSATLTTDPTSSNPVPTLTPLGTPATLIDTSYTVSSCSFTCTATTGSPPTIGVKFTVLQNGAVQENNTSLNYATNVTLRNSP